MEVEPQPKWAPLPRRVPFQPSQTKRSKLREFSKREKLEDLGEFGKKKKGENLEQVPTTPKNPTKNQWSWGSPLGRKRCSEWSP